MEKLRALVKLCASLKITVICLLLFMVITLMGTLYQISHDINEARKIYFTSWYILINGVIPFPGGQTLIWIFFINLVAACLTRIKMSWKKAGVWLTHIGLIGLCFSSFYTYKFSTDGMLTLFEGEKSQFADVDNEWEFSIWTEKDGVRHVTGYNLNDIKVAMSLSKGTPGIAITLKELYTAANAYQDFSSVENRPLNQANIVRIEEAEESGHTFPGAVFMLEPEGRENLTMMLYGAENSPTGYEYKGITYYFQLRPRKLLLPANIKLDDVIQETYTGTDIAKRYESKVTLTTDTGETRKARIYMNHPLTIQDFTFYQSGYSKDPVTGRESSSLSVVKNAGKYFPYIACILITIGMILHFCIMFIRMFSSNKNKEEAL
ncbi:MAG: cytochrome c biogenesis protein ResB [Deltaproteobacteria bacterium]|nr:cytochrome c biogenesis protein ResB [Deltaproteobacteria bacterium]